VFIGWQRVHNQIGKDVVLSEVFCITVNSNDLLLHGKRVGEGGDVDFNWTHTVTGIFQYPKSLGLGSQGLHEPEAGHYTPLECLRPISRLLTIVFYMPPQMAEP